MDCVECPVYPCPFSIHKIALNADGCGHTYDEIVKKGNKC